MQIAARTKSKNQRVWKGLFIADPFSVALTPALKLVRIIRFLLVNSVSPCLLRNSSKKPLYFDVLIVSFRYLLVEDKQGSSVVKCFSALLSLTKARRTLRMH